MFFNRGTVGHPNYYLTLWLAVLGAGVLRHLRGLRPLNRKLHRSRILLEVAPPQRFGRSPRFNLIAEQFQCKIRASEDNCRLSLDRPTHHLVFVIPTLSLNRKSTFLEKMPFLHWSLILFRILSTTYAIMHGNLWNSSFQLWPLKITFAQYLRPIDWILH